MRVLFISWWWPYPADNGAKIRIYNLLQHLSRAHQVTLLSFAEAHEATTAQIDHLRSFCTHVESFAKPQYNPGTVRATLGYLSPWPRSLIDVYSPIMAKRVETLAHQGVVDVIVGSEFQTMRYLELAPEIPAVLEELEVTLFHNRVQQAAGTSSRFRAQLTLTKMENAVRTLLKRGVAMTVVSEAERDYIRRLGIEGSRIEVIPNGVDTNANQPDPAVTPLPNSLIYTGAVTYDANYDAVSYFIRGILPLVRVRIPDAQLTVTGGTGEVDVRDLAAQPGVTFTGYLPSVADEVRKSWALVVPLQKGGGTRLKVLEALALGTPVISTRKGIEGLDV
ncbi:MAG: glycosyltransferase family 4 protein, partial [Anaerolineae bacterium]|nr:glycosyltransferase family 4 protein [Anaerolineae bacterium]